MRSSRRKGKKAIPDLTKSSILLVRVVSTLGGVLLLGVASFGAGQVAGAAVGGVWSKPLTYYLVQRGLQDAIVRTEGSEQFNATL